MVKHPICEKFDMKNVFNFSKKKSIPEAVFFYILSFLSSLIIAGLFGGLMGAIGEIELASLAGVVGAVIFVFYLSIRMYTQSKLSFLNIFFLLAGIIVTTVYGSIFGLLPVAIATCYINDD